MPKQDELPSAFTKDAWIVDNEVMDALQAGKLRVYGQYAKAVVIFTKSPKKWGTILSKIVGAVKEGGEVLYPIWMAEKFLLLGRVGGESGTSEGLLRIIK